MNRRQFTRTVLSGGVSLFLPKIITPNWKPLKMSFQVEIPVDLWWIMEGETTAIVKIQTLCPGNGWRKFEPLENNLPETGDFTVFLREKYQLKNQT